MRTVELTLSPEEAFNEELFTSILYQRLGLPANSDIHVNPVRRSIDARSRHVIVRVQCELRSPSEKTPLITYQKDYNNVSSNRPIVVVGSGPAGLFAALRLIELGYKPIVIERGKDVQTRRRDIAAINKDHEVNPESNYCFGEGGAGTYSDGKLYTRSKKRGDIRKILEIWSPTEPKLISFLMHILTLEQISFPYWSLRSVKA